MASLNLSANGPSINKSYQSVLNAPPPAGPSSQSSTYGQWAIFTVQAPLVSAFQNDGGKESVMKVQSTGEGELLDFVEEFSDGRIQFGFVRVKDPNTTLPKCVLVGWCGEGVPERTKGYFTSHLAAVSKLLQGYHVQITARSDSDIAPERIVQKVADSSGSRYSGGGDPPPPAAPRLLAGSKPVFMPTRTDSGASGFNPLGARSRAPPPVAPVDADGWGEDAPQVTRTQLEKVASAYQPTKINMAELTSKAQSASRFNAPSDAGSEQNVIRGGYQPVGKVDIAEIRRQAKEAGQMRDDRPTPVKGAYEPVGTVDIATIRSRAQPPTGARSPPLHDSREDDAPKSLDERSAAFQSSERMTSLPKPRVANKFGSGGTFMGTKASVPSGFAPKTNTTSAPVGIASRTFADEGGKTPSQIWAEKKARQGGAIVSPTPTGVGEGLPVQSQKSGDGGWKSSYAGKSWAPVHTTRTGQSAASNVSEERHTGNEERAASEEPKESIGSIRDRFAAAPPPMDMASKPNVSSRAVPSPPAEEESVRPSSPIRVAMPVGRSRGPDPDAEPQLASPVAAASRAAETSAPKTAPVSSSGGLRALVQYDYEKAEDNEIELKEGEYVTNVDQVDEDWWMGQNAAGETGLFPANYVEIVEEEPEQVSASRTGAPPAAAAAAAPPTSKKVTATAQYDYEAAEENELSFPDGAKITNVEFPDDDWWFGEFNGKTGLFPANYVQVDE